MVEVTSTKLRLKVVENEMSKNKETIRLKQEEQAVLFKKKMEYVKEIVLGEKTLSKYKWKYADSNQGPYVLQLKCVDELEKQNEIVELFNLAYHDLADIFDDVAVATHAGNVFLLFKNKDNAFNFIKEHQIKIDTELLDENIAKTEKKLEILKSFKTEIGV